MATVKGRSLELYFIDGRPDGMLTAEVFNWTGHVLVTPRTRIVDALKRKEARYTGVYLLLGQKADGVVTGYIGEADDVSTRIRKHDLERDWWEKAIIITSAANQLNKAHVRYLEARLIQQALSNGRLRLENETTPDAVGLSEAATANMESFLEQVFLVLPAVRIDYFLEHTRPIEAEPSPSVGRPGPIFELKVAKHSVHGKARLVDGEFVVQKGSLARSAWVSLDKGYKKLYDELVDAGILVVDGENRVFVENYAFRSPSAAAAVITGRASNGRMEWKVVGESTTYAEWEEQQVARDGGEGFNQ